MFPKIGVPQNGWFILENTIKMDDLGAPLFSETPNWLQMKIHFGGSIWCTGPKLDSWMGPVKDGSIKMECRNQNHIQIACSVICDLG